MAKKGQTRFTVEMPKGVAERMERLKVILGARTKAEVFRRSMELTELIYSEGKELWLRDPGSGEFTRVLVPGVPG